jgi:hypothetical protein
MKKQKQTHTEHLLASVVGGISAADRAYSSSSVSPASNRSNATVLVVDVVEDDVVERGVRSGEEVREGDLGE